MNSVKNVLIVGAGMCGMSLGVALRRAGINCEIVEIRPKLTEPGTGISLQGPALRALRTVGVLDHCISRGFGYSYFKACDAMGNVTAQWICRGSSAQTIPLQSASCVSRCMRCLPMNCQGLAFQSG